jgi:hypothetical protein
MPTVRVAEGLVLAVLLPICFSRIRRSDAATGLAAGVYGVFTVLPMYERWQAWLAVLLAAGCAVIVRRRVTPAPRRPSPTSAPDPASASVPDPAAPNPDPAAPNPDPAAPNPAPAPRPVPAPPSIRERLSSAARRTVRSPLPLLAIPAAFGAFTLGGAALWRTVWRELCNDRLAVTVNGALAAVFVGGLVTGMILGRFSSVTTGRAQAVLGAGTLLGWLERMLYFSFLLAGQPTAAAFALTAKSAARFPALQRDEEGLAEYYLIGSLSSLVAAAVTALLTRLALGMSAL